MYHKKKSHRNKIKPCKNNILGTCWFGESNCWFEHETEENDNIKTNGISNTNEEVIAKMFNLMETFTNRIMKLEETINDETNKK